MRYWSLAPCGAFSTRVGRRGSISIAYFGIGLQASDEPLMTPGLKRVLPHRSALKRAGRSASPAGVGRRQRVRGGVEAGMNLPALDALRGMLAVYVLLGHCRWLLWTGHGAWMAQPHETWAVPIVFASGLLRYGREAVIVFFVLSGFFIHLRNAEAARGGELAPQVTSRYLVRRAHRLLPPYAFALLVTVACDAIGYAWFPWLYAANTGDGLLDQTFARSGYSWPSVGPALWLLPSSMGFHFGSNGPLWSLAFEVLYYLAYPLWFGLRRRSAVAAFGVLPVVCLAIGLWPASPFPAVVAAYYPAWLTGAFLAERLGAASFAPRWRWSAAAVFAAGAWVHFAAPRVAIAAAAAILFGGAAVLLAATVPPDWRWPRWQRAWQYLGARSYTIYVVHFPFLALLSAWWLQAHGTRPAHGWFAVAGAAAAIAFGCVCFELCERHFLHRPIGNDAPGWRRAVVTP